MAGIGVLGAAVGSFAEGYMKGEKHRSEMEDAELRREAARLGIRKGKLEVDEAESKAAGRRKMEEIAARYSPYLNGDGDEATAAAPVTAIAPPGGGEAPEAPMPAVAPAPRAGGISVPGAAPAVPAAPAQPKMSRLDAMQRMYSEMNAAGLASGNVSVKDGLDLSLGMMKRFRDAKMDDALAIMQDFAIHGDPARASAEAQRAGLPLPQGATWSTQEREVFPGSKMKTKDVVLSGTDGVPISMLDIMSKRMDPKDFFSRETEVAKAAGDLAYKAAVLEDQKWYHGELLKQNASQHQIQLELLKRQTAAAERQADIAGKKFNFDAVQARNLSALNEATRLIGVPRELTPEQMRDWTPDQQSAYDQKRQQYNARLGTTLSIYALNNGRDTEGKELLPVAIADRANNIVAKAIQEGKVDKVVKTDDMGHSYVMVGERKVEVLPPNRPQAADAAPPAAPAPGAAPAPRQGIQTPGAPAAPATPQAMVEAETREIEMGRRRDYSPEAKAIMQKIQSDRAAQEQAALQAEQQRQIAASRGIAGQYR
jgi:hypothetical protein